MTTVHPVIIAAEKGVPDPRNASTPTKMPSTNIQGPSMLSDYTVNESNIGTPDTDGWRKMRPIDPLSPEPPSPPLSPRTRRWLSIKTYLARFPEWSNPSRLNSLYSQFDKLKINNPFGYEANVSWWRNVILGAARRGFLSAYNSSATSASTSSTSGNTVTKPVCEPTGAAIGVLELELDLLVIKFHTNGRRPQSLQAVLEEMTKTGDLVRRSEFMSVLGSTWTGWLYHKVVKGPLLWGMRQLSLSDATSTSASTESLPTLVTTGYSSLTGTSSGSSASTGGRETYLIMSYVQEAASRILILQNELTSFHASDNLMTFADFRQKFARTALLPVREKLMNGENKAVGPMIVLTDRDLEIVLRFMQQDMKAVVIGRLDVTQRGNEVQDQEMVIKFCTNEVVLIKTAPDITKADRGIIELRQACKRLEGQIENLESRIVQLTEKARVLVKKQQKLQAMSTLKQRKYLQDMLDKRIRSLDTLSSILFKIQLAETDAEILQAYKLGSMTLASVMATKNKDGEQILSRDNAEATMDHLAEVFADQQEIDEAMGDGALQRTMVGSTDDDELIAELDALMGPNATNSALPALASGNVTPISNNSPTIGKQPVCSRPIPIKRTSSPKQGEIPPTSSPTSGSAKRVAELPKQAASAAKQRKVSQTSVHSPRRNSIDEDNVAKISSIPSGSEGRVTSSPPVETAIPSMMQIDRMPVASADDDDDDDDEREIQAMLRELDEIGVPQQNIPQDTRQDTPMEDATVTRQSASKAPRMLVS
ncbi:hypothetical protein BGZ65_011150 [Modicella reniformis]|uniref:Charged multivesicular body protein 7 n=1 Tax=Modicella reniformis TaxID=1440133 RepID=A0A9P6M0Y0_9FUNG|nr:hypothetical protein BGZ65_011150 [Modicella reniformis]